MAAKRTGKPVQIYLSEALAARVEALATSLRRTVSVEITHAIERHLARPPRLVLSDVDEAPPVVAPKVAPKKRGPKPKKEKQ